MQWKVIPGFEKYKVSDTGKVWGSYRDRLISIHPGAQDYMVVILFKNGKRHNKYVHRLVIDAFVGLQHNMVVNHKDGNKLNNCLSNLELVTPRENNLHAVYSIDNNNNANRARLTNKQTQTIIDLYNKGVTVRDIQKRFDISVGSLYAIVKPNRRKTKRKERSFDIEDNEIIKEIDGFPLYYVSDFGNVYSAKIGRKLTPKNIRYGYKKVNFYQNTKCYGFLIHRLVAQAFIPNPGNKPLVHHKNSVTFDNRAENLEWVTHKENSNK